MGTINDLRLRQRIKQETYNLKRPDFAEVIATKNGKVDVKLLQRPGIYKDCEFYGSDHPKIGEQGVLFYISSSNIVIFDPFARNLGNNSGEWRSDTPVDIKSNYPYISFGIGALLNLGYYSYQYKSSGVIPQQIIDEYNKWCKLYNIDPNMMLALAWQESTFNPYIVSKAGAVGWGQFMASTWKGNKGNNGYAPKGHEDPKYRTNLLDSIYAQCTYMRDNLRDENGDMYNALRRYNGGPAWRSRVKWNDENIWYAPYIFKHYNDIKLGKILGKSTPDKARPYLRPISATSIKLMNTGTILLQSYMV